MCAGSPGCCVNELRKLDSHDVESACTKRGRYMVKKYIEVYIQLLL